MVPNVLLLAVPLDGGWVLLAIPPPVIRVARAPLLRAVPAYLAVFGIQSDLLAVIIAAATPLASGFVANRLPRLILRRLEEPLTVAATPFIHKGVVSAPGFQRGSFH